MKEIEFAVPKRCDLTRAEQLIEQVCAGMGLLIALKGTLSTYPGSLHWHYKRDPKQRGTLELTLFIPGRRIWAKVQTGRKAPWIDDVLADVKRAVEQGLRRVD